LDHASSVDLDAVGDRQIGAKVAGGGFGELGAQRGEALLGDALNDQR
jgi:hypothetical protein